MKVKDLTVRPRKSSIILMPQVSKRLTSQKISKRLPELLIETIVNCSNSYQTQKFLDDFLTPTEKIMLGKRLAIAVLLLKGYDYATISQLLKVSSATIGKIVNLLRFSDGGLKMMAEKQLNKDNWKNLLFEAGRIFLKLNRPFRHIPERVKEDI